MENSEHFYAEMKKVRAATPGEVIMFAGPDFFHSHVFPSDNAVFRAGLGIYSGISDIQYITIGEKKVKNTLNPDHNMELAVIESEGVYCPLVRPSIVSNLMCLGLRDDVYVGPESISELLKTEGKGLFDKFFEGYVAQHRKSGN